MAIGRQRGCLDCLNGWLTNWRTDNSAEGFAFIDLGATRGTSDGIKVKVRDMRRKCNEFLIFEGSECILMLVKPKNDIDRGNKEFKEENRRI